MSRPVKVPSRPYRSVLRAEQAQSTRRRILDVAARLFVERGYAATTVNAVAADAGVAPETIYGVLGGKKGLLGGVIESTIANHVEPLRLDDDSSSRWAEIGRLPTAPARLRAWGGLVCDVLCHTSPVHAVIRGAADGEPFAVELRQRLLEIRLADVTTSLRRYIGARSLRPGLTLRAASQRATALVSPELHHLLTVELGWTADQHRRWVCDLLEREILGA